ncbi:galactokinase [Flavobacterium sp. MAH-1]|uniref:Galactokinase n=1 Tax=Flavobacterium agri TaxID=2743471 RepID=A0A7Y8Y0Y2_9FLAO|nr:galactokinase [Flavobacterium agri]NUY80380.1 galactokinase [Flavobacterium agri]NYA70405.1 galactokinase [Flavobacterium agri]
MKKKKLIQSVASNFLEVFKSEPEHVFLAPGRINIIGEHVDYNDGYVLPAAINKYICFAVSANDSNEINLVSQDLKDAHHFRLSDEVKPIDKMWANYMLGVFSQLKERGSRLQGFNVVFASNIPMGAGLSSSAALECGFGYMLNKLFNLGLSKKEIALIGQKSEHTFAGVNCGIMDQYASVFGKEDHVFKLDCTTLEHDYHTARFDEYSVFLMDSKVKHTHLTSGYNDRRREATEGLEILKTKYPEVRTFRDLTVEQVETHKEELGDVRFRRCHFVVGEIRRVLDAVDALEASDFKKLGKLMTETHNGLSKEYEVSCEEIDFLVEATQNEPEILGSRMMGGGFGGCSINLVKKSAEKEVINRLSEAYQKEFDIEPAVYKVKISDGCKEYKKFKGVAPAGE